MISRLANLAGPLSSFSRGSIPKLILSLDSINFNPYIKDYTVNVNSSGVTYSQNSITSIIGNGWQNESYSNESYSNPTRLKFNSGDSTGFIICGLSDNPTSRSATYDKANFAFYLQGQNTVLIREGGSDRLSISGTYTTSTNYSIIYDGSMVQYFIDDKLVYVSNSVPSNPLYLYTTFLTSNLSVTNVEFGDKTNTYWLDSSTNGLTFSMVNSPSQIEQSMYFDGVNQYAEGGDLGSLGRFTIDTWFNLKSLPLTDTNPQIVTNIYDAGHGFINFAVGVINGMFINEKTWDGKIVGGIFTNEPDYWTSTDGFNPQTDSWYNAVMTYDRKHLQFYLNGNLISSVTYSNAPISSSLGIYVGRRWDLGEYIDGNIDIVRVWNGPLTSGEISDNYTNISDRYLLSTRSMIFNGSSYIVTSKSSDWALGNTYTIEFWSKSSTGSGGSPLTILSQGDSSSSIDIYYQNGNLYYQNGNSLCSEPTPNVWTHVALVSNSGVLKVYYDGVLQCTSTSNSLNNSTVGLAIGRRGPYYNFQYFSGKLWGIRIVGSAVYLSDFNPYDISLPPEEISETSIIIKDYKSSSNTFIDSTRKHTMLNHDVLHSTDIPSMMGSLRFALGSNLNYKTNGSGYLKIDSNDDFNFGASPFTIEWWQNIETFTYSPDYANPFVFSFGTGLTASIGAFFYYVDGVPKFYTRAVGIGDLPSLVLGPNQWIHYALSRDSSYNLRVFENGVTIGSMSNFTNNLQPYDLYIGVNTGFGGFPDTNFSGYISNFHVIKGHSKYSNTFTPSVEPITATNGTVVLLNNLVGYPYVEYTGKTVSVIGTVSWSSNSPF